MQGNFKNNLKSNFTIIDNDFINIKELSLKAKGLFLYLASKPSNWNFSVENTSTQNKDGLASINSAMKELEDFGYLERKRLKNETGSFTGIQYSIQYPLDSENTIYRFSNNGKPNRGESNRGKPNRGKPMNISNTITSNTKTSKNELSNLLLEKEAKENFQNNQDLKDNPIPSTLLITEQDESALGGAAKKSKFGKSEFRKELVNLGASLEMVDDWFAARDKKKLAYTRAALNRLLKECDKHNFPIPEAVSLSAERGWGGFEYKWTDEFKSKNNYNGINNTAGVNTGKVSGRTSKLTASDFVRTTSSNSPFD